MVEVAIAREVWPIAGRFAISRGARTEVEVVTVTLTADGAAGRGECVPYPRYGESVEGVIAALEAARPGIERGLGRHQVADLVEPRAARNALDCALWDLQAKLAGAPVWQIAGLQEPEPLITAYTLSLDDPAAMAEAAVAAGNRPLLKLKLGGKGDRERLDAVRQAAPEARLIVDANEGWRGDDVEGLLAHCARLGVEMVEQPLPADDDGLLAKIERPVAVCADESAHDREGLGELAGKYDMINIKLDKTGGLTEALALKQAALEAGFKIMVGCMLATSLAMAPAVLVAQGADVVDLDGPLLLARDRTPALTYDGSLVYPPERALWG